ncbi:hypothetical protein V6N13_143627 [Hibiscus sabdariffa]
MISFAGCEDSHSDFPTLFFAWKKPKEKHRRLHEVIHFPRKEGHANHSKMQRSPTMGGLFFLPVGIFVANFVTGFYSVEVAAAAAAAATLVFAMIGPIDDVLCFIKQHNSGLSPRLRLLVETILLLVNAGKCLFLLYLHHWALCALENFIYCLTPFCFVSMGNGVSLTDGVTAALAFIGLSIAVLPICPG